MKNRNLPRRFKTMTRQLTFRTAEIEFLEGQIELAYLLWIDRLKTCDPSELPKMVELLQTQYDTWRNRNKIKREYRKMNPEDTIAALNETVARLTAENAAKDAQIQALQDKLDRAKDALTQSVESRKEYFDV